MLAKAKGMRGGREGALTQGRSFDVKWLFIIGIVAFLILFEVFPMVYMFIKSFFPAKGFSLASYRKTYGYELNQISLRNTLVSAFGTMVLGTLIAFPLAWLVGRTNLYYRKFFRGLCVMTYMVPPYVGAMAWSRLLNPNVGIINVFLRNVFHLSSKTGPFDIYTIGGMIWVLTSFYYPYAFITISRAMEKMDPSLEEASRISGASSWKTLWTITLPMMTPSIIAGALLVFVSAASAYGIPSIIGANAKVKIPTVTTRIIDYVGLGVDGLSDAMSLAVFLMLLANFVLYISTFVVGKRKYITVSGKSTRPNTVDLGRWRVFFTVLMFLFAFIMIVLPFVTVGLTSITKNLGKSVWEKGNFTTMHWSRIFSRKDVFLSVKNSLLYAVITATFGIIVSVVMANLLERTTIKGRRIPDFLITVGSGTPSVVIALGLIMTMRGQFGINLYNTMWIMIIAYLVKYLMMGMRTVVSAMSQIHVSLEECSRISGAGWLKTTWRITIPLIAPSIAAGWFLIFIPTFYELSMSTLLYSKDTQVIGYKLHYYWTYTSQQQASAIAFGILVFIVILNSVLNKLTKGEFSI